MDLTILVLKPKQTSVPLLLEQRGEGGAFKKLLRVMKLITIFLFAAALHVCATGNAQQVTLSVKNAKLETVFKEIKKQTGYQFLYNNQMLDGANKVTIDLKAVSLSEALNSCFLNQPVTYEIVEKTIIVKQKNSPVTETNNELPQVVTVDISGRVTDTEGNSLAGASVKVKGTTLGTTTNADGVFVLKGVDESATLIFSYAEYETVELKVEGRTSVNAALKKMETTLQEVVINKGYYTEKQKYSVSNVGRVTAKDIEKQPINNPLLALQGRVPGLFITQNTGMPGGGVTVRIQGQNSIEKGNSPLFVVDGVPYFSALPTTGLDRVLGASGNTIDNLGVSVQSFGSPLSFINPSDIESIEILKDADATAIFGSRAANGAILITTKKGKAGKTKFDVSIKRGWGKVTRKLEMMNTQQYLAMRREALKNDNLAVRATDYDLNGVWDTTRNTDWQKTLIGNTANYTNANVSISGGANGVQFLIGANYNRETSVFIGDFSNEKGSVLFNINATSPNQRFRLNFSGNYLIDNNNLPSNDLTQKAIMLEPNAPALTNIDGSLNWAPNLSGNSTWTNPLAQSKYSAYENKTQNIFSNLAFYYRLLPGFEIGSSLGFTQLNSKEFIGNPIIAIRPEDRPFVARSASYGFRDLNTWIIEPQANYKRRIGTGSVEALVGTTFQENNSKAENIFGQGYNSDLVLKNILAATSLTPRSSYIVRYRYSALFGRFNYNLNNKYVINITGRRDGSTRFGSKTRFHNFWSLGSAWIFSNEDFVGNNLKGLSLGKIRASYGLTGSDQIGDYSFMSLFNPYPVGNSYQGSVGVWPAFLSNPSLEWEETKKLQIGLDIGFLADRLIFNATYADNRSSNQLLSYILPSTTGFYTVGRNFPAIVKNTSWEFSFLSNNFKKGKFSWTSSINLTIPKNRLLSFPNLEKSSYANRLAIGQPLNFNYFLHYLGVDPATGKYQFGDFNQTKVAIDLNPKFYGGLSNSFELGNFKVDFLFQFVKQNGRNYLFWNGLTAPGVFRGQFSNQPVTILNHWQKPGDISSFQKFSTLSAYTSQVSRVGSSDAAVMDASFIRLKNVSFSYKINESIAKKIGIKDMSIYTQGQNLMIITNYKGLDPENMGNAALPPLRVFVIGMQVGL